MSLTDQSIVSRSRFSLLSRSGFLAVSKAMMFIVALAVMMASTNAKAQTYTPTQFSQLARYGGTSDCSAADGLNITADDNNDIAPNSSAHCTASGFAPSGTVTTQVMHLTFAWYVTSVSPGGASLTVYIGSSALDSSVVFNQTNGDGNASITIPIGTDLSTISLVCTGNANKVGYGGVAEVSATGIQIN
jgi:hypothetical protein